MTGKEFLIKKMKEEVLSIENDTFKLSAGSINLTYNFFHIMFLTKEYGFQYAWGQFDFVYGIDFSKVKFSTSVKQPVSPEIEEICSEIQKRTAMLRFYYKKGFSRKDVMTLFNLSEDDIPKDEKIDRPNVPTDGSYPSEVKGKGAIRIKVKESSRYGRDLYRIVALKTKLTNDNSRFIASPQNPIGNLHSSEVSFLTKDDAEEFIKNNPDIFSSIEKDRISFITTQTHTFKRIPVVGSDKAYVDVGYLRWRNNEGKISPKFS